MRFLYIISTVTLALFLGGCTTNHNNDYLSAQEGPTLKLPAGVSSYAMKPLYPVPAGATWENDQPIQIYPPDSRLAKSMQAERDPNSQTVALGIDAGGSAALNVNKPYPQVWKELPKALKIMGYRVSHNDPRLGLYIAKKANINYQFTILKSAEGNNIISVRNEHGVTLGDRQSNSIILKLQKQLRKVWQ